VRTGNYGIHLGVRQIWCLGYTAFNDTEHDKEAVTEGVGLLIAWIQGRKLSQQGC
jgi:hypothetical protein